MRGRVPKYPPLWRARVVVWVLLVALLVFPGAGCLTFGQGRCICPWAAARPLAVRAASFARRVGSLSGQALPSPTDTAAMSSGALCTSGACGADAVFVCGGQALPPSTDTAAMPSRASADLLEPRRVRVNVGV